MIEVFFGLLVQKKALTKQTESIEHSVFIYLSFVGEKRTMTNSFRLPQQPIPAEGRVHYIAVNADNDIGLK